MALTGAHTIGFKHGGGGGGAPAGAPRGGPGGRAPGGAPHGGPGGHGGHGGHGGRVLLQQGQNNPPRQGIPLDVKSPLVFDTNIYGEMQAGTATLQSDNVLGAGNPTAVALYLGNQTAFFNDFSAAYVKMGQMGATWKSYGP